MPALRGGDMSSATNLQKYGLVLQQQGLAQSKKTASDQKLQSAQQIALTQQGIDNSNAQFQKSTALTEQSMNAANPVSASGAASAASSSAQQSAMAGYGRGTALTANVSPSVSTPAGGFMPTAANPAASIVNKPSNGITPIYPTAGSPIIGSPSPAVSVSASTQNGTLGKPVNAASSALGGMMTPSVGGATNPLQAFIRNAQAAVMPGSRVIANRISAIAGKGAGSAISSKPLSRPRS